MMSHPVPQSAPAAAGKQPDCEENRVLSWTGFAVAQRLHQQLRKRAPSALIRSFRSDLIESKRGQCSRAEQMAISPKPVQRVLPIRFAADGSSVFFDVVHSQNLVREHYFRSWHGAKPEHPFRVLVF